MKYQDGVLPDDSLVGILEFPCSVERLPNGNTLIADAGSETGRGSEIIEVNNSAEIVWRSSHGYRFAHAARRTIEGTTVIADTTNDRILEVDAKDNILFSSEEWGGGKGLLSDGSSLLYPNNVQLLADNLFLVTNRNSNNFVVVDRKGKLYHKGGSEVKHPHNCEQIAPNRYIAADSDQNRIVELDENDKIVWHYSADMNWPRDANRLANGNTLITDSKNSRVFEVDKSGKTVWEYKLGYFANLYEGIQLQNGSVLFSDQQHHRVVEVNRLGKVVWEFRNFKKDVPVFDKLTNGFFMKVGDDNLPLAWNIQRRFSEGGGSFLWTENAYGKKVPTLEYDRHGALCLQQTVKVVCGDKYDIGCALMSENLDGFACLQVAFKDEMDGLLCDAALSAKGASVSGDSDWIQDSFQVTVPDRAVFADIRFFITGKGRAAIGDVRFRKEM